MGKTPACGVHGSNHEGLMITATRLEGTWLRWSSGQRCRQRKAPTCGVHGSHHEGLMIRLPVGRHLAAPLVGQGGSENNIPAEGVHGCNHEPLHDERGRGFFMKESSRDEFAPQFFACEQFNRINSRRAVTGMRGNSTGSPHTRHRLPGGRPIWFSCSAKLPSISPVSVSPVAVMVMTSICRP